MATSPKHILQSWAALVALWATEYLEFLEELSLELAEISESFEWPLLIIGAMGTGSIVVTSCWSKWRKRNVHVR